MNLNRYIQDVICRSRLKQRLLQISPSKRRRWRLYVKKRNYQSMSRQEVIERQTYKLQDLLRVSMRAPYYREILKSINVTIEKFTLRDMKKIPILTKDIIRREKNNVLSQPVKKLFSNSSGGSTGEPVNFYQDQNYLDHEWVLLLLRQEMAGWYYGARLARLWGAPQDMKLITGFKGKTVLYSQNTRYYDSFDMSEENMEIYHKDMSAFRPEVIISYASSIYLYARFLEFRNIKPDYPLISIISSAETLYPHMRETVERVFSRKVFDVYGSRETSTIACECEEHTGLHVFMEDVIVECLDPESGEDVFDKPGDIIVTDLNNYGMPFIRYKIGDMGIMTRTECKCERHTLMFEKIVGRTTDNYVLKDGTIMHGEYFTHLFYGQEGIKEFQFVQETLECFNLYIVKDNKFSDSLLSFFETEIKKVVGEDSKLDIHFVESVPKTPTGKYKFTISKVDAGALWEKKKSLHKN